MRILPSFPQESHNRSCPKHILHSLRPRGVLDIRVALRSLRSVPGEAPTDSQAGKRDAEDVGKMKDEDATSRTDRK